MIAILLLACGSGTLLAPNDTEPTPLAVTFETSAGEAWSGDAQASVVAVEPQHGDIDTGPIVACAPSTWVRSEEAPADVPWAFNFGFGPEGDRAVDVAANQWVASWGDEADPALRPFLTEGHIEVAAVEADRLEVTLDGGMLCQRTSHDVNETCEANTLTVTIAVEGAFGNRNEWGAPGFGSTSGGGVEICGR